MIELAYHEILVSNQFTTSPTPMIVVTGSSNTDLVITCPVLPKPGESIIGGPLQRFAGGKGANQAVAASRAGAKVAFIGARGNDEFGKTAAAGLKKEGIDIRHFKAVPGVSSGTALILIGGKDSQNLIGVATGANDVLPVANIRAARALFTKAKIVVTQLEVPMDAVMETARLAQAAAVPLVLNPAPARKCPGELLKLVHTITPNEHEACIITGRKSLDDAAAALLRAGVRNVIITRGAMGAAIYRAGQAKVIVPAPKVKPVDTVGAGDCFNGWLAVGLAVGLPVEEAAKRAVKAASIAVTRPGAQAGMPYLSELK